MQSRTLYRRASVLVGIAGIAIAVLMLCASSTVHASDPPACELGEECQPPCGGPDNDGDGVNAECDPCYGFPNVDADDDNWCDSHETGVTGTDPFDDDTDDDGFLDSAECLWCDPLLADTDRDGVQDGTESGLTASQATDTGPTFVPDADPNTTTDPVVPHSDGDLLDDGTEDADQNGRVDAGETDPNEIDSDQNGIADGMLPAGGFQDFEWVDPGTFATVSLTPAALETIGGTPGDVCGGLRIVSSVLSGPYILDLAAGDYHFDLTKAVPGTYLNEDGDDDPDPTNNNECRLVRPQGGLILRGSTSGDTNFIYNRQESLMLGRDLPAPPRTSSNGTGDIARHATQITVEDAGGFAAGDDVRIVSSTTAEHWRKGQTVRLTSIVGNTLHFDLAMGIDLSDPLVLLRPLASDFGAENIKFSRTNPPTWLPKTYHLKLDFVSNSYVKNNEFSYVGDSGVHVHNGRRVVIQGNQVHDMHFPSSAGSKGLGISVNSPVSEVKIVDNVLWTLRHHIELVNGVNHTIVAYNIAGGWTSYADIGAHHGTECHNILFEGNLGNEILTDALGPLDEFNAHYIVQFRNRAFDRNDPFIPGTIGTDRLGDSRYSIVGNEVPAVGGIHSEGGEHFVGANIEAGQVQWGYLDPSDCIVPSLFLDSQPPYVVGSWPLYGPPDSNCP